MNTGRLVLAFALGVVTGLCNAQAVTNLAVGGSTRASTQVTHLVTTWHWSTGSGRGGGYVRHKVYTTTAVTDQSTSAEASFVLNGAVQSARTANTFWNPAFTAVGTALSTYQETNGIGALNFSATSSVSSIPSFTGYQASSSVSIAPFVTFAVPTGAEVTIETSGTLAGSTQFSVQSSSVDGDPTVSYKSANVVDLAGGYTYRISFLPVGLSGVAGLARAGSLNIRLTFAPGPEIN